MQTNTSDALAGSVTEAPLLWLRAEGAVVFFLSILLYAHTGRSWWLFLGLLLTPDLAMTGYLVSARWGAALYNLAHSYVWPAALASAAMASSHAGWLPFSLIWGAHIAMDRTLGYGLKYPSGFQQTHLGWLGKR